MHTKNLTGAERIEKLLPEYELARSIMEQRLRKKMTQLDVAKKTDMPRSSVARIEGLTHGLPRLLTLKKIAQALDSELVIAVSMYVVKDIRVVPPKLLLKTASLAVHAAKVPTAVNLPLLSAKTEGAAR